MEKETTEIEVCKPVLHRYHHKQMIIYGASAFVMALCIVMLVPQRAYAAGITDFLDDFWDSLNPLKGINALLCGALGTLCQNMLNSYSIMMTDLKSNSIITGSFGSLMGNSAGAYGLVTGVHQTVVIPLAESILALFMLVQLIKISQRIDATATLPAVKDIVFLAVTYVLMHWLIANSLGVIEAVYNEFNKMALNIGSSSSLSKTLFDTTIDWSNLEYKDADFGGCLLLLILSFVLMATGMVAFIVAQVVALARSIQIYVMAAFSPIPLSLLGFDETRQMGISFLKNFCAAALAGAIMLFVFAVYPYIFGLGAGACSVADLQKLMFGATDLTAIINSIFGLAATSFVFIYALVKSGSWASAILGS